MFTSYKKKCQFEDDSSRSRPRDFNARIFPSTGISGWRRICVTHSYVSQLERRSLLGERDMSKIHDSYIRVGGAASYVSTRGRTRAN